jgi:hypothetical protein
MAEWFHRAHRPNEEALLRVFGRMKPAMVKLRLARAGGSHA